MARGDLRQQLVRRFRALPFGAKLKLAWLLLRDRRTPPPVKLIIPGLVAYLLTPVDIIPDFIPILGQLDDALMVILALGLLIRFTPSALLREHIERLEAELSGAR